MQVGFDPIRVSIATRHYIKNHFSLECTMPPMENGMQVLDICIARLLRSTVSKLS